VTEALAAVSRSKKTIYIGIDVIYSVIIRSLMNSTVKGTEMVKKMPREKRQEGRGSISVPASFTSATGEHEKKWVQEGRTADFSESGLGIYSPRELKKGAILEIECQDMWDAPKKFTVQWCNRVSINFFRSGLSVQ
jgi:hypothetical protein